VMAQSMSTAKESIGVGAVNLGRRLDASMASRKPGVK